MRWIESVWQELEWSLPLVGIRVQAMEVDDQSFVSLYGNATDFSVASKLVEGGVWDCATKAQGFLEDLIHESQVSDLLVGEFFLEGLFIAARFFDARVEL